MMASTVASFLLTDRPWIPVLDRAGLTRFVSLREVFNEAHEIRTVVGDLPTQTFSIIRLLLAVLHRAVDGPADEKEWRALWTARCLPVADIDGYLSAFGERFDLLHPTMPFYQVADLHLASGEVSGLQKLVADVPAGAQYLTSRAGPGLARMTVAEAARWVVHCHAFDTSGIKSGAVGDPRVKGGKGYPIGPGLCGSLGGVMVEGKTLRETLLLNLIPFDTVYLLPYDARDKPAWERPPHGPGTEPEGDRGPFGRLSLYTWQSRRLRLFGDEDGITGVVVACGDKLSVANLNVLEPMSAWRRSANQEKALKLPQVYMPALHDPSRALWRGLGALLPDQNAAHAARGPERVVPAAAQWLARVRNVGHVDPDFRVTVRAVGVVYGTQQSVVDEVYHDAVTMSVRAFDTSALRASIVDSASDADAAVKALRDLAANLCRAAGGTGKERKDPPVAAAARAGELAYAELDQLFRGWLATLGSDTEPGQARVEWHRIVRRAVGRIGADLVVQAGPSAWAGRTLSDARRISAAQADVWFRRDLSRALPLASPDPTIDHIDSLEEVPS